MKQLFTLFLLTISISITLFGQENDSLATKIESKSAPIPTEIFATNKGFLMNAIVAKNFSAQSKFGLFALMEYYGDYKNVQGNHQFLGQSFLSYNVWKGFSLLGGATINQATGFKPTLGFQYLLAGKDYFILVIPRFDLVEEYNFEAFAMVEYMPKFSENWGLYTRVQGLYNQGLKHNLHDISYIRLRLGASYKNFRFGIGANYAFYGPLKHNENSYGLFVRAMLF